MTRLSLERISPYYDVVSLSGCGLFDEISKGILHGVEVLCEFAPDDFLHLFLPFCALSHVVLDGPVDALVARDGVLHVGGGTAGSVLLESCLLCLHLVDGLLNFLEVSLESFECALDNSWYLGELFDIEGESHEGFGFLHVVQGLKLTASVILDSLSLLWKAFSLLEDLWDLLSDTLEESCYVVDESFVHVLTS